MCFEVKKKFTYLSMCSCCNAVSKYPSTVKKHLQRRHSRESPKGAESLVIPIRIENRFEKKIKRTLDKDTVQHSLKRKPQNQFVKSCLFLKDKSKAVDVRSEKGKNSNTAKKSVKCLVCHDKFIDHFSYLYHLGTSHSNLNVKVSFRCPYCKCIFLYLRDLQRHFEKGHVEKKLPSYLDCINVKVNSSKFSPLQRQCPYCDLQFLELKQLHDHVRESHNEYLEMITIRIENDETVEMQEKPEETILLVYNCRFCQSSFHTVQDLVEHMQTDHAHIINTNSKPTRKRKPPKWLENDTEIAVKKPRSLNSNENSKNMVEAVAKITVDTESKSNSKCKYCDYSARTSLALSRHIKANHPHSKQSLSKGPTKEKTKQMKSVHKTRGKKRRVKRASSKRNSPLVVGQDIVEEEEDSLECQQLDDKSETSNGMEDTALEFDENDAAIIGDSDDDYLPGDSGSDSENNLKQDHVSFNCMHCNKSFSSKQSLDTHIGMKHKTETVTRYKCPFCDFYLHHFEYVKSHVYQSHPEATTVRVIPKENVNEDMSKPWETFKCPNPKCTVVHKKKPYLLDHVALCAKGEFRKKEIECTLPAAWMEKLKRTAKLICPYCESVTQGKANFENHLKEHYPGKTFEVKLNNTLPSLQQMKKEKCRELQCSMCPYCEMVTTQKVQLVSKHFKRCHSNEVGSDVISCILMNRSLVKEEAVLVIRDNEKFSKTDSEAQDETKSSMAAVHTNYKSSIELQSGQGDLSDKKQKEAEFSNEDDKSGAQTSCLQNGNTHHDPDKKKSKIKEETKIVYIQSTIPCAVYICPICNDFKTRVKKDINLHMKEHNCKPNEEIDSIYPIPDSWIKIEGDKKQSFKCQICDFEDINLTLAFRHILDCHKDLTVNKPNSEAEISQPLFEMMSVQIEGMERKYEKQKYRCTTCFPRFNFKTRKGLRLHMKTHHMNSEEPEVYEAMYHMLDAISDSCDTRQIYYCSLCQEGICTKSDLIDHFYTNHSEKYGEVMLKLKSISGESDETGNAQLNCEVCYKQFTDEKSLKHHLILHVNKLKPTCRLCELCFTNVAELECHNIEVHSESGEMCYKCGAMFSNAADLNRHIKFHETDLAKILCQYCGTSVIKKNMKKHLVDKHNELLSCDCQICTTQTVPEGKKYLSCKHCNAIFCTWYMLKSHKMKGHCYEKDRKENGMLYSCGNCDKTFTNKRDQFVHTHKCGKLVTWSQTTAGMEETEALENGGNITEITVLEEPKIDFTLGIAHVKKMYISVDKGSDKPFICKLCGKAFSKTKYACLHLRRMHTEDETKRYRCKVCKMGFHGFKDFKRHCRTHIGLREHQCKVCQKRFLTAGHLKEHYQTHTSQTYPCGYCGLEFRQRGAVLAHVVHHDKLKPLKCLYCEKGFTTHGDLQRHMNSYAKGSKLPGAKQLTFCTYCSKDFPNHNALTKHFQIHLPVNPFKCLVCQKSFSTFREMYNHKSRINHFTNNEIEEGKKDLQAPGNRFRKYQVTKSKSEIKKTPKDKAFVENPVPESTLNSLINDDQNIIEIEIGSSTAEHDERTKAVLAEFEGDVIKSMLDADPEILDSVDFHDTDSNVRKGKQPEVIGEKRVIQDDYQYHVLQEATDSLTMQDMYAAVRHNSYADTPQTSQTKASDNSEELANMVLENIQQQDTVPGKTQTFQTSDGSIIHVCVIKPDK